MTKGDTKTESFIRNSTSTTGGWEDRGEPETVEILPGKTREEERQSFEDKGAEMKFDVAPQSRSAVDWCCRIVMGVVMCGIESGILRFVVLVALGPVTVGSDMAGFSAVEAKAVINSALSFIRGQGALPLVSERGRR